MAIAFRNASTTGGSGTSVVLTKPTDTVDDDFMMAGVEWDFTTGDTITAPAGWTLLRTVTNASSFGFHIYYKKAASEGASWTWTLSTSRIYAAAAVSYSGVKTTGPIDVETGAAAGTSGTTLTAGSVTTTAANDMLIIFAGARTGGIPQSFTAPGGMTERADVNNSGGSRGITVAELALGAAGATGTKDFTSAQTLVLSAYQTTAVFEASATGIGPLVGGKLVGGGILRGRLVR